MPRTEAGMRLLARLYGGPSTVAAIEAIEAEASIPDRDALARALHRLDGLGMSGLPTDPDQCWHEDDADAIIAALKEQP